MSISVNIHGNAVRNQGRLFERLYAIKPRAVLVLDSLDMAQRIKAKLPDTTVIFREYEGGKDVHKVVDPMQWLDTHAHQAEGGITLNVLNEPPFNQEVIDWLLKVCVRAIEKKVRVCVGNWAVGNPTGDPAQEWPKAERLLELASQNPDYITIGLHEYFAAVPTSGLIGGNPTMLRVGQWPAIVPFTRWHCGRFQFLLDYCHSIDLKPPRLLITEAGADNLSDVGEWLKSLKRVAPDKEPRSWRTLATQWREWYPQWSTECAYFEMLKWLNETIYKGSPAECQMIFCYGHSSDQWLDFDVEEAGEFWDLLIAYSKEAAPMALPFPDKTDMRWRETTNMSGANYYVRPEMRVIDMPTLPKINAGERFYYIQTDDPNWLYGKNGAGNIGYVHKGILTVEPPAPPPEPPPAPPQLDLKQGLEALNILISQTENELSEINHELVKVDNRLKLLNLVRDDLLKVIGTQEVKAA